MVLVAALIGSDTWSTAMSSKPIVVWMVWMRAAIASCWDRRTATGRRVGRVEIRESACNVILVMRLVVVVGGCGDCGGCGGCGGGGLFGFWW